MKIAALLILTAAPAIAQHMPGMTMPTEKPVKPKALAASKHGRTRPRTASGMAPVAADTTDTVSDAHPGHAAAETDLPAIAPAATLGTDLPAGDGAPPAHPGSCRRSLPRCRGEASEAEVEALYSRAINPYSDPQGGLRQDFGAGPKRSYATVGVEGLAPYWFEVEARLYLSNRADIFGRLEAWNDQRLTERLVLQPRVELNFAAKQAPRDLTGRGLSEAELGLRLRCEIVREFALRIPMIARSHSDMMARSVPR